MGKTSLMKTYSINDISIWSDGLDHPECVAIHPDGSVWAGGEAGQIYRISTNGKAEVYANTGGFVLGIAFSPEGWLAICDLKKKAVLRLDLISRSLTIFADGVDGRNFQTPNYPVFDRSGNLYVSDSGEFRKQNGCVFKFSVDGKREIWQSGPFPFTNGMALSAAEDLLYVVSTWLPGVEAIPILPDGSAGKKEVVVQIPETCPDGIAIDQQGNLLISCYAPNTIYCLDKKGLLTTLVHDWESHTICNPTNIAFGGPENRDLFIANLGRWHIAKLSLEIPGLQLAGQIPHE